MKEIILSIFVPCFNEENNVTNALNDIKEGIQTTSYEILIADDDSTDNTIEVIEKFKKNNPDINIKIFRNEKNRGLGYNFWATAHKALGKYYFFLAGDGGTPPNEIKKMVNNIGKADMILAYFIDKRGVFRRSLSKIFVMIINLITLNNIKYYNNCNIHLLENVKLYSRKGSGFGYQAELITEQIRQKKTYIEVELKHSFESPKELSESSQALKLHNILSVIQSIILIFLKQIAYAIKKITFHK